MSKHLHTLVSTYLHTLVSTHLHTITYKNDYIHTLVIYYLSKYLLATVAVSIQTRAYSSDMVSRAVADPNIKVSDLETAIDNIVDNSCTRDLDIILDKGKEQTQWRSTPKPDGMCALAPVAHELLKVCKNGVAPTKKLENALKARQETNESNSPMTP